MRIASKKQEESNRTLAERVQDSYLGCMQRVSQVLDCVSSGAQQGKHILEMTAKVIQTNLQIFHIVLNIQSIITQLPGQVERQQSVHFIDALGRHTPFHLEFIMSAEALTSVLRSNFKNIGSGADKIDRGEFAIQDSIKRRDIDLTAAWESCFRPGQRVDMSMIFTSVKSLSHSCPTCQEDHGDGFTKDQDIECRKCGVTFRLLASDNELPIIPDVPHLPNTEKLSACLGRASIGQVKRKRLQDEDDEMALFRRVRVRTSLTLPSSEPCPGPLANGIHNQPGFVPVAPTSATQTTLQDLYAIDKEILDLNSDTGEESDSDMSLDTIDKEILALGSDTEEESDGDEDDQESTLSTSKK